MEAQAQHSGLAVHLVLGEGGRQVAHDPGPGLGLGLACQRLACLGG